MCVQHFNANGTDCICRLPHTHTHTHDNNSSLSLSHRTGVEVVVPLPPIREVGVALVGAGQEGRGDRATVMAGDMKCSKDHIVEILGDMEEEEEEAAEEEATSREAGEGEEEEVSTTAFSVKTPFVPGLRPYETEVAWYVHSSHMNCN